MEMVRLAAIEPYIFMYVVQIEVYEGIGIILWQMKNHVELLYSHMKMVSGNM